jgi:hypothetical protein
MKKLFISLIPFFIVSIAVAAELRQPDGSMKFSFQQAATLIELNIAQDKIKSESVASGVSLRVPVTITTLDSETKIAESKISFFIRESGKTFEDAKSTLKERIRMNLAVYLMAKCSEDGLNIYVYPSNLMLESSNMSNRALNSPLGRTLGFTNNLCRQSAEQKAAEMVSKL